MLNGDDADEGPVVFLLVCLFFIMSCGPGPSCKHNDAGQIVTFATDDLNKVKSECLRWEEYAYYDYQGKFGTFWWCSSWAE